MPATYYLDTITQKAQKTERFYPHSTLSQFLDFTNSLLPILDLGDLPYLDSKDTLQIKQ